MSCGEKCEVYSRAPGYFRPVSNWNSKIENRSISKENGNKTCEESREDRAEAEIKKLKK